MSSTLDINPSISRKRKIAPAEPKIALGMTDDWSQYVVHSPLSSPKSATEESFQTGTKNYWGMSLKELLESRRNSINVASVARANSQAMFIHFEGNDVESCESAVEPKPNPELLSYYQNILKERQHKDMGSKIITSIPKVPESIASSCLSESIQIPAGLPNTPELFSSDTMEIYHTDSDNDSHCNFSLATAFPEMDFGLKTEETSNGMDALFSDLSAAAAVLNDSDASEHYFDGRRKSSMASLTGNMEDMGFQTDLPLLAHVHKRRKSIHPSPPMSPAHTLPSLSPSPSPSMSNPMFTQSLFPTDTTDASTTKHPFILPAELDPNTLTSIALRCIEPAVDVERLKPLVTKYMNMRSPATSGERTVMILTSKVAQKSYGTEKRFLCPPPTTLLLGSSWWTPNHDSESTVAGSSQSLSAPKINISISGEPTSQQGVLEWHTQSSDTSAGTDNVSNVSGKCVSKHLYINDADDKRKRVECLVNIQLANGRNLGTVAGNSIKVISKPSKKRQSVKNVELCIHNGSTVSLFNRIRSQTVSTKYLGVNNSQDAIPMNFHRCNSTGAAKPTNTSFVARTGSWDPFVMWIVDTTLGTSTAARVPHDPTSPLPAPPAIAVRNPTDAPLPIHYNQPVVLQCVTTGLVSPVMVVRKVDKGSMVVGGVRVAPGATRAGGECADESLGDPVSQLHKIAFQIVQDAPAQPDNSEPFLSGFHLPRSSGGATYLACINDAVGMHRAAGPRMAAKFEKKKTPSVSSTGEDRPKAVRKRRANPDALSKKALGCAWTEDASDASVWTIVGTDCATYSFWVPQESSFSDAFKGSADSAPLAPFPNVKSLTLHPNSFATLQGDNLTPDLSIWFGGCPVTAELRGPQTITFAIPSPHQLAESAGVVDDNGTKKIPILLARPDGVVYRTGKYWIL
ncbi:hypothetical protein K450DRAFT_274620 [Umbelopsis ramanniana AG]|uniref:LAG1-DNAbind-domain-containing protein n=1 Tax=Umbelopsis ramanniana AG TaxID=1314678 RepID=A0AAD5E4J7_UMBRA|nr:uncharacterized protein K450DRAFT_274620 [Umbelopsis ramanniana AG]KAI8576597.1 hypothetical protein K450DRAFT_274620 [Umbelopsis ramanniana AG]